jgi:hypothetical protein
LQDCYSCNSRFTVMIKTTRLNPLQHVDGPKFCDIVQVKHAYDQLKMGASSAPTASSAESDEGEEPVDDDTPIVVPKP